jgi:hypothetical protein
VAPKQPLLLATASTIDVGVDALAEAGISELLRRQLISTEVASALARWRAGCVPPTCYSRNTISGS